MDADEQAEKEMILNLGIPESQYPDIAGTCSGTVIVAGSGRCVWDDLQKAEIQTRGRYEVLAINDMIMHFPGWVRHAYSNDHEWLPKWVAARRELLTRAHGPIEFTHSHQKGGRVTWPWPGAGSSALGATYTALALGYDEVILVGIPLDDSGHYFDPPWVRTNFIREVPVKGNGVIKYWADAAKKVFNGKVRAVSGRLTDVL